MNLIGKELRISAVAYGPGNPRLGHIDVERISVEDYLKSILERGSLRRLDALLEGQPRTNSSMSPS